MTVRPPSPLAALRRDSGLSQAAVAAKLGLSRGVIGQLEIGVRKRVDDLAADLARIYGVEQQQILDAHQQTTKGAR